LRLPEKTYAYSRSHRFFEIAAIVGLFVLLTVVAWRGARGVTTWGQSLVVLAVVTAGYFLTDFISGFFHWAGDSLGSETMPILGAHFVKPFRFHHVDQKDITRHDFIETNGNNCIISILPLLHVVPHQHFVAARQWKTLRAHFVFARFVAERHRHFEQEPLALAGIDFRPGRHIARDRAQLRIDHQVHCAAHVLVLRALLDQLDEQTERRPVPSAWSALPQRVRDLGAAAVGRDESHSCSEPLRHRSGYATYKREGPV